MNPTRLLPLALTVLLAACGGGTSAPTPTPPVDPSPPTAPVTPPTTPVTPPTPGQPANPGAGITHYGEWGWNFQGGESYQTREGRFSIIEAVEPGNTNGSVGLFQFCYSQCIDRPDGYAIMGINTDSELIVTLFRLSSTDDLIPLYEATDADGKLTEDDRGRLVFEGRATAYEEFVDVTEGDFQAVFIADEPALAFAP